MRARSRASVSSLTAGTETAAQLKRLDLVVQIFAAGRWIVLRQNCRRAKQPGSCKQKEKSQAVTRLGKDNFHQGSESPE